MKRIAVLMAALMVMSTMVACGSKDKNTSEDTGSSVSDSAESVIEDSQESGGESIESPGEYIPEEDSESISDIDEDTDDDTFEAEIIEEAAGLDDSSEEAVIPSEDTENSETEESASGITA